jgi:hypothetical protein
MMRDRNKVQNFRKRVQSQLAQHLYSCLFNEGTSQADHDRKEEHIFAFPFHAFFLVQNCFWCYNVANLKAFFFTLLSFMFLLSHLVISPVAFTCYLESSIMSPSRTQM